MELRKKTYEIPIEKTELFRMDRMENDETQHLNGEEFATDKNVLIYLQQLNHNQRLCLDLMYFQKKSYKEIADETGLSLKAVKSHIQNGKRNLRNFLRMGDE
jgi:RNA polymerase sigma-70 factor (ECF subfamily)